MNQLLTKEEIKLFQVKRQVIALYKAFLVMLEDQQEEHISHFEKLYNHFKEEEAIIRQADYFTDDRMSYLRKKVLDAGNDCVRNITGEKENGKG